MLQYVGFCFLPVVEKPAAPCVQVPGPLLVVGFELHPGQLLHLIRVVLSACALRKNAQQTQQEPAGGHDSNLTPSTLNKNNN